MKHSLVSWCCLLLLKLATRSCVGQEDDYPVLPDYDLCNPKVPVTDPPRIYMNKPGVATEIFVKWVIKQNDTTERQCHMLFKSCPYCRIKVELVGESFWNQPCVYDTDSSDIPDCIPGCIYMYLNDIFYKNVSVRASDSYSVIGYRSQSSQLNVVACAVSPFHREQNISMRLRLTAIDKLQEINGDPYSPVPRRTFTSPNFPNPYVSNSEDYPFEFQSSSLTGFITVSFDDWVVSPSSEFLIEGANLIKVTGQSRRPYIISNGQSMRMSFNTGEFRIAGSYFTYLGFKAVATFYKDRDDIPDVQTDCGQMITDSGGFISLSKVADGRIRDCIWVIKKATGFDGVYLKLLRYRVGQDLKSYENKLEIKVGLTSTTDPLLAVIPSVYGGSEGFDARSDVGFYIRLKGSYLMEDALVISYAMFISDCTNSIDYFKCGNGRCIPAFLKCDNYDHCGDKSDESTTLCNRVSESSRGSDYSISIGVIIPMVVSVFLVIVMCLLIIFIRRCRRLNNSTFGNRPNGVTQAQGRGRRRRRLNHNVQMSVTVSSGEHPPSYEEVIQNTPIGYLNMAFSWFQSDTTPTAPPSYEEAVMPPSATPSQNVEPAAAHGGSINNLLVQGAATLSSPQHQVSRATFMASLDPGAYVSSSSSSEYASEPENRLDLSSSSDTSTDEHSSFITHSSNQDLSSRASLDLNKNGPSNRFSVAQNAGKSVSNSTCKPGSVGGDMQVELDDISLSKHKTPANIGGPTERSRLDNDLRKNERNVRENSHQRRRDRTSSKEVESIKDPKREGKESDRLENGTRGSRDALNAPEHGNDGLYVKRNHKKPIKNGTEGPSHYSGNASKITESSRSQSCFDLSLGGAVGGAVPSYSTGEARYEDKRFSYAGYGDVSLKREDLDPFCTGRGLVRDRPVENLNKYTAQSCDNLLQGYNIHANRDHHMVHENPQQSSSSCLDVSITNRKTKQPHHTSSVSLSKFSDAGRSLHPVPEIGHPRSHAEPNRHTGFDKNSKPESHSAQVTPDLKPLQPVPKSTHDYKSSTAISRPVKHGQTSSRGNIPNSKAADMLTLTPGPCLVLSDDAHRSTPDQEHQRVLSPNSDGTSHNPKDVAWLDSSEHKNSSDKAGLPLLRDQYSFENPHSRRADAQRRDRQPQSHIATPTDDEFRSHPKSVSPSDRRAYQKEAPEPIYQRPNQSRENGRWNSGNSAPSDGRVRHNQGPEPIYKVPNNQSRDQPRSNQENNLTMGENVGHKQRPESIYQVPRQNQAPPRENPSSSQLRPSQSAGNVLQKPTPAPRQAKKSTSRAEREQAPIPRMRSHRGTERRVGHPDNSTSGDHPEQQSHHNQRPARATGDRLGNSARGLIEETELRGRSDQAVLTLDPNIFQATENDVFV
ncbi:unnamed protein product [Lymnaea stagnalis]|uniref:CUB domain-containing protein n=1 Tax=Lymnaea stagnalis TaxID=6523 RepID=A0AAV2HZE3_LYMST